MSTLRKRAQRALFLLTAGLICFSLIAPIAATAQEDVAPEDATDVSTEETLPEAPTSDETTDAESSSSIPWKDPIDYGVVVDNSSAPLPADGLACRVDAYSSAEVIERLWAGQSVEVTGQGVWAEGVEFLPINCAGQGGFVKADYVALNSEAAEDVVEEEQVAEEVVEEEAVEEEAAADEPVADQPVAGDLIVTVLDQNGAAVAGACFDLYSAAGWVAGSCDSNDAVPNNGNSGFFGIPEGSYTLIATSAPSGAAIPNQEAWVTAGDTSYVTVSVAVAAVEEPAAEEPAAEESTNEEPAADASTSEEPVADTSTVEEPAQDEAAIGDLIVTVVDQSGAAVAGACFDLYSAAGLVASACDSNDAIPDNGNSGFFGIPEGDYTLVATVAPGGIAIPDQAASVTAADTSYATVSVTAGEVAAPTDEPAQNEDEVVTEEPAATEIVTEDAPDEGADEPAATEVASPTAEVTEEVPATDEVTATEEVTEAVTGEASPTAEVTEEVPATEEVSPTAEVTEEATATEEASEEPAGLDLSKALGDATVTGTNGEGVRCRVAPEPGAATITVLAEGTTVLVLENPVNGFLGVVCGSQLGYADINFMWAGGAGEEIPDSVSSVVVVGTGGMSLNCRTAPNGSVITAVPQGTVLTSRGASSNGWAPVVCGGQNGFVSISFIEATSGAPATGGDTTTPTANSTSGTGTVSGTDGDGLRCRTAPNGSVITVVADGTVLTTRGAASNGWVPVVCGGSNGFVSAQYFTIGGGTTNPGTTDPGTGSTGYVKVTGTGGANLNCRTAASSSGMIITSIPAGSTVATRGATTNGWVPVTCGGRSGYVSSSYVTSATGPGSGTTDPGTTDPGTGTSGTAVVANTGGDGLRCRTAPNGSVITVVAEGATVTTRGAASNGWTPVTCGGQNGYMSSQYLSTGGGTTNPTPTPTPPPSNGGSGMTNGDHGKVSVRANMRYQPSISANVMTTVDAGEVLLITGNATNGWYPVDYDGWKAYMSADLLVETSEPLSKRGGSGEDPDPAPNPGGGGGSGGSMVSYAMGYVGYPYRSATHGPSSFDCSGFTYWVTKNVMGSNIGTGLWTQWAAGTAVSRSSLQPGDLVFFQNTYKAGLSHVGIYIGNDQFVHAENENTGVRVSSLSSTYYSSRWLGARRL